MLHLSCLPFHCNLSPEVCFFHSTEENGQHFLHSSLFNCSVGCLFMIITLFIKFCHYHSVLPKKNPTNTILLISYFLTYRNHKEAKQSMQLQSQTDSVCLDTLFCCHCEREMLMSLRHMTDGWDTSFSYRWPSCFFRRRSQTINDSQQQVSGYPLLCGNFKLSCFMRFHVSLNGCYGRGKHLYHHHQQTVYFSVTEFIKLM